PGAPPALLPPPPSLPSFPGRALALPRHKNRCSRRSRKRERRISHATIALRKTNSTRPINGDTEPENNVRALLLHSIKRHPTQARSEEHTSELQSRENLVC